jgi:thiamine-monophosphate kinase
VRQDPSGRPQTLADVGEDGLLAAILARLDRPAAPVLLGPGDDAAVIDVGPGPLVVSTDTMVEGYDFLPEWSRAHDVGVKLAAQNLADVAAMGAHPVALLVSLAAPSDLAVDWATGLADGLAEECRRAGAAMAGGDLAGADRVTLTGTALGRLGAQPAVLRSGARAGDVVALAGQLGRSGAVLALLQAGWGRQPEDPVLAGLVRDHLAPRPPYAAGPLAAAAGATAMIDVSDGAGRDARRIAEASGAVLDLDPAAVAPGPDLLHAAAGLHAAASDGAGRCWSTDPFRWVLAGGEDHALLACFPPGTELPDGFVAAGRVLAGRPDVLVGGVPFSGGDGWRHFEPPPA